jgi:hypothetical protein
MGLILSTKASTHNFNQLISLKEPVSKEAVITKTAKRYIEESEKARLGWGHTLKKFVATTTVYSTLLMAPIAALLGSIWAFADKLSLLMTLENLCIAVPSFGALLATDVVFGKIFGIRPMTVALLATLDAYRNGAGKVAGTVEESYTNHERATERLLEKNKKVLVTHLKTLYTQIANDLTQHSPEKIQQLQGQLPLIEKGLVNIGLTKFDIAQILEPLEAELELEATRHAVKISQSKPQKRFWIF